jgi:hypothetical protein
VSCNSNVRQRPRAGGYCVMDRVKGKIAVVTGAELIIDGCATAAG